jgi:tetratricopeptide (TPR) repeat protein
VVVVWTLSLLEWFAGRLRQALDHALTAHELTEQTRLPFARAWVGRAKALVEADLGLVDEARASAGEALEFTQTSNEFHAILALGVLGRLELALGNLDAAAGYLRELPGRLLAGEMNDPAVTVWPDAIETLISLGQVEPARSYLERYELRARRLGGPWAPAAAARCRGLLHAAETDPEAAFEAFARAHRARRPIPLRARPHTPLSGDGAQTGEPAEGCARGARSGARDLRAAARAAVDGQGAGGARADQRAARFR